MVWDNGHDNVYRYGAENAFDVIEYVEDLCYCMKVYE